MEETWVRFPVEAPYKRETMDGIILALSTFRKSEYAIQLAFRLAEKNKRLVICYFTDENIHKYIVDVPWSLQEQATKDIIHHFKNENTLCANQIRNRAIEYGLENVEIKTGLGRFFELTLEVIKEEKPEYVITTRSNRIDILRKIFGSPVDKIKKESNCPVLEI